ncbi:MAG: DUF167 domain-containing protein [Thermoanaerobaculia bacterium]
MSEPGTAGGLEIRPDGAGARLRLRVSAGASRSRVVGVHGGALKLSVAAAPEKGKANREVVGLVAATFGLSVREVEIVAGEASPDKVVRLPLSPAQAAARWAARADD